MGLHRGQRGRGGSTRRSAEGFPALLEVFPCRHPAALPSPCAVPQLGLFPFLYEELLQRSSRWKSSWWCLNRAPLRAGGLG